MTASTVTACVAISGHFFRRLCQRPNGLTCGCAATPMIHLGHFWGCHGSCQRKMTLNGWCRPRLPWPTASPFAPAALAQGPTTTCPECWQSWDRISISITFETSESKMGQCRVLFTKMNISQDRPIWWQSSKPQWPSRRADVPRAGRIGKFRCARIMARIFLPTITTIRRPAILLSSG